MPLWYCAATFPPNLSFLPCSEHLFGRQRGVSMAVKWASVWLWLWLLGKQRFRYSMKHVHKSKIKHHTKNELSYREQIWYKRDLDLFDLHLEYRVLLVDHNKPTYLT